MSDKIAPAPWVWEGDRLVAADRKPVIDAIPYEGQWIDPDSPEGVLIAAAPDMLAALQWIETYARVQVERHPEAEDTPGWSRILAAIAKATGA